MEELRAAVRSLASSGPSSPVSPTSSAPVGVTAPAARVIAEQVSTEAVEAPESEEEEQVKYSSSETDPADYWDAAEVSSDEEECLEAEKPGGEGQAVEEGLEELEEPEEEPEEEELADEPEASVTVLHSGIIYYVLSISISFPFCYTPLFQF